jgi:N-acetylglucosamine-6-phosphate deacetylase
MPVKFFDLQVNGYAGIDFNRTGLSCDEMDRACDLLVQHGAEGVLATVITDSVQAMATKLAQLARYQRAPLVGIHIEGPFISAEPGYIGAHPPQHAGPADLDGMKRLLEAAGGLTRMVTLAPEQDDTGRVTQFLAEQGVVVSAGHCNPSLDQLKRSIDHGLTMFTHLGNGCPSLLPRHDNIIQRVLSLSDQLHLCYIADGTHVPYLALRNYLAISGIDRSIIVTDAISAAGLGPGTYSLGEQSVEVGDNGVVWAADRSHFVGSACTMPHVVERLATALSLTAAEIEQLIYTNPKRMLPPLS